MPNRLIHEKSPYLLQHANNPVDWYPWGDEAFEKAKKENKPIFLSIGYSTCHWCHVMAHESFEDPEVAEILNKYFVSIKVDREERPDIDNVYMAFCNALTGRGGWPLSVFMTPDKKPFYAGTYFPKYSRYGITGFIELLRRIAYLWQSSREEIENASENIAKMMHLFYQEKNAVSYEGLSFDELFHRAYESLKASFDPEWGGFSPAPKFPTPHQISFLLRYYKRYGKKEALVMAEKTLMAMAYGGIYDQLGGGFHRYSVDAEWLVPHFEKMLYDQALISTSYLEAFQLTKKKEYLKVAEETLDYVLQEMVSPEGGYYSAVDADSEGKEGEYYLWTSDEIKRVLGSDWEKACLYFGVTEEGDLEGKSVLRKHLERERFFKGKTFDVDIAKEEIEHYRKKLLDERSKRPKPLTDDKILTSWNGLMISTMARAGIITGNYKYVESARKAADFILTHLMDENNNLFRRYREGDVLKEAFLEDYAFFNLGLLELFFVTSESRYLRNAIGIAEVMIEKFWDFEGFGFFFSPKDGEKLIFNAKNLFDGATPSGNSVALEVLTILSQLSGSSRYESLAWEMIKGFWKDIMASPIAHTYFLCAIFRTADQSREIWILTEDEGKAHELRKFIYKDFSPGLLCVVVPERNRGDLSKHLVFLKEMTTKERKTTIYWCEGKTCSEPIDVESFKKKWSEGVQNVSEG